MRGPDAIGLNHDAIKPTWLKHGVAVDALLDRSDLPNPFRHAPSASDLFCDRLLRRLANTSGMNIDELRPFLRADQTCTCRPGKVVALEGEEEPAPRILLSGWACYQRIAMSGRRQIFAFVLPGDFIGCWPGKRRLQADIVAITPLFMLKAGALRWAAQRDRCGALAEMLREMDLQHVAHLYRHIQRLGSQHAVERVYDLLWELHTRMDCGSLRSGSDPLFPLTQETLADALGMTSVHINRVLQQMRREGLISLKRGHLTVHPRQGESAAKTAQT